MKNLKKILILFIAIFALNALPEKSSAATSYQYPTPKDQTAKGSPPSTTSMHPTMATEPPEGAKGYVSRLDNGNVSCVGSISLLARIVYDVLSAGLFEAYLSSFSMVSANNPETNASTCNDMTPNISYNYNSFSFSTLSMTWNTVTASDGDTNYYLIPPVSINVTTQSDLLCVQVWLPILGYQNIGCKYTADPSTNNVTPPCFVAGACMGSSTNSLSLFRITSSIMECLTDSLNTIFYDSQACVKGAGSALVSFSAFRSSMQSIVGMLLTLYVIFFGFKISLGGEMPPAGEVITFLFKMLFVIYFSVGFVGSTGDGVLEYVLPFFLQGSSFLAQIMTSAGGSSGLCIYPPVGADGSVITPYNLGYEYLGLWDGLDCKLAYYMGMNFTLSSFTAAFEMIIASVIGFQIVFSIILIS